jgi:hypothetical protein
MAWVNGDPEGIIPAASNREIMNIPATAGNRTGATPPALIGTVYNSSYPGE